MMSPGLSRTRHRAINFSCNQISLLAVSRQHGQKAVGLEYRWPEHRRSEEAM